MSDEQQQLAASVTGNWIGNVPNRNTLEEIKEEGEISTEEQSTAPFSPVVTGRSAVPKPPTPERKEDTE